MAGVIKYKGSLGDITAGYAYYQIMRIKYRGSYVDLTDGTQSVTLYVLDNYGDALSEAIVTVIATFPVSGYSGDGYCQFKFLAADTTGKEGRYYYKIIWNNGSEPIQISKPKSVLTII